MKLTPIDIMHKSFNKKMFGLDEQEVNGFLSQISSAFEDLIAERNQLREMLREKEFRIAELRDRDQVLQNTIQTASQMAEVIKQDAEREAKLVLADAQHKSDVLTRDAKDSLRKIYQDINELKKARLQFEANLKALVQSHMTLLEQGEKYMPQMNLAKMSFDVSPLSAENDNYQPGR